MKSLTIIILLLVVVGIFYSCQNSAPNVETTELSDSTTTYRDSLLPKVICPTSSITAHAYKGKISDNEWPVTWYIGFEQDCIRALDKHIVMRQDTNHITGGRIYFPLPVEGIDGKKGGWVYATSEYVNEIWDSRDKIIITATEYDIPNEPKFYVLADYFVTKE